MRLWDFFLYINFTVQVIWYCCHYLLLLAFWCCWGPESWCCSHLFWSRCCHVFWHLLCCGVPAAFNIWPGVLLLLTSLLLLVLPHTVIRFLWVRAKLGTCTVVSVNGTLVEAKMCTFTLESMHFLFNKCPIYTHGGASSKLALQLLVSHLLWLTSLPFLAFMLLCGVLLLLGPSVVDIRYIPDNISTIVGNPPKMNNFRFFSSKRSWQKFLLRRWQTDQKCHLWQICAGFVAAGGQCKSPERCDHQCCWRRWCILTCEYLQEFSKQI